MDDLKALVAKATFLSLQVKERDKALLQMVDSLVSRGHVVNKKQFYQALLDREALISTGIGMGVAIPHARVEGECHEFFLSIGVTKKGIDWGSIDDTPVRLIFLLGGPKGEQGQYLELLSALTTFIKEFEIKEKIVKARSHEEVINIFNS